MPSLDPRQLRPTELARLLNSTPLGEVVRPHELYRQRDRAGYRIGDGKTVNLLRYVAWLVFGKHGRLSDFVGAKSSRIVIESDEPVPYELDGDPRGWLPLEIEVLPRRLTLLVPQQTAPQIAATGGHSSAGMTSLPSE